MSNLMDVIQKGEMYLTFVFDGIDSTTMKIASVSSGSTYNTAILPAFQDNFLDVDGYNGRYYFNTRMPNKDFRFNCFIDNLSAYEYDCIKAWLRPDKIAKLIVPETPHRYHWVKISSIGELGNIPLTHPDTKSISYTGAFDVTFSTIGQAAGYSELYYIDDLLYFEYRDIYPDITEAYLYDMGLLYKEESLPLDYVFTPGTYNMSLYNPGTYPTKIGLKVSTNQLIEAGNITITNKTTGDVSAIQLENLTPGSILDINYARNTYLMNGEDISRNVMGDLIYLTARDVVERINNATVFNDGTSTKIKFAQSTRQVRSTDIGKTAMFKEDYDIHAVDGVGGKIKDIDKADNAFILEPEAGLFTNPEVNVIITRTDDISISVSGGEVNMQFAIQPRYI